MRAKIDTTIPRLGAQTRNKPGPVVEAWEILPELWTLRITKIVFPINIYYIELK